MADNEMKDVPIKEQDDGSVLAKIEAPEGFDDDHEETGRQDTQYDSNNIPTGYTIYMQIDNTAASDRTEYETLDEAKLVANKKVEEFILSLIDMRDYKINELLNKKED